MIQATGEIPLQTTSPYCLTGVFTVQLGQSKFNGQNVFGSKYFSGKKNYLSPMFMNR